MNHICTVHHIDAFSSIPNMGNPAGVVEEADFLDEKAMQDIAKSVGFNETAFILPSSRADLRLRFFAPSHEVPLCGHATVASVFHLGEKSEESCAFTIETIAGILPVSYNASDKTVSMRQAPPQFTDFTGDKKALATVLGVDIAEIDHTYPIAYGSTGTWTLLVPTANERALFGMKPDTARFPDVLTEMPRASIHPFVVGKNGGKRDFVARHFSSPHTGTVEDPVTGTASAVMGAYAMTHMHPDATQKSFTMHQGASVGRDGVVFVDVVRSDGGMEVSIKGTAVHTGILSIPY